MMELGTPADATCGERARDRLLVMLSHKCVIIPSVMVVIVLICFGTFFAMLLIGLLPMFSTDDKNYWSNFSIQILTGILTYLVLLTFPWCA